MCCVSSRKNRITGKVLVFPLKNWLSEVKEITVALPFSWMLIFFRDRGVGRCIGTGIREL
jgi:hypothetical protein